MKEVQMTFKVPETVKNFYQKLSEDKGWENGSYKRVSYKEIFMESYILLKKKYEDKEQK